MFDIMICGINIFCYPKYWFPHEDKSQEITRLCKYFDEQRAKLPDYCNSHDKQFVPRRRSDF